MSELNWSVFFPALAGIGAFVTAIATIVKLYLIPWRDKKRKKRLVEKKQLEQTVSALMTIKNQIEKSLERDVKQNNFARGADIGWWSMPKFDERVKEYHEGLDFCKDFYEACKDVVELRMMRLVKNFFPITTTNYPLDDKLQKGQLANMYINGEKVTYTLIKESYPDFCKEIVDNIKEDSKENKLDNFFLEINSTFRDNIVLKRYRQEKKGLIDFGQQLKEDFEKEISLLEKKLLEYKDLKDDSNTVM